MENSDNPLIGTLVYFALLFIYGIVNAFYISLDNSNETLIEDEARNGSRKAKKLMHYLDNPTDFYDTTHLINGLCYLICGLYCIPSVSSYFYVIQNATNAHARIIILILVALAMFLLFLLIGYAFMRIGGVKEDKVAYRICNIAYMILSIFAPVRMVIRGIAGIIVRFFGVDPNKNLDEVSEDEIISMVNEGHEQGLLESSEAEMIHNIFEFMDKDAGDIMTHRKNMVMLSGELTFIEAMDVMLENNISRYPIYMEDTDNIIGVVHIRDCMEHIRDKNVVESRLCDIDGLIREVSFIPETRNISDLFHSMQAEKNHLVIVVDEYGQTSGLVTMEDILEEIVGNIFDEYDEEEESITKFDNGEFDIDGMTPLDEVAEELQITLPVDNYDTLNGYLISLIDRIPAEDEQFSITAEGYTFEVLSVENKMIQSVHVSRCINTETEAESEEIKE